MKLYGWRTIGISFLILLVLSIPFWIWNLDVSVQRLFFDPGQDGWHLHKEGIWPALYKFGIFPGLLLSLVSLFLVAGSYWRPRLMAWRKPAWFMVLALMLGPGLLINLVLKDNYGRPRPREITTFGGQEAYVPLLIPGAGDGKSFPCGHGSIGFYLALPFLFLYKSHRRWAWSILVFGLGMGALLTYARMVAGGHFLSDGLWGAGLVWICGLFAARIVKLDEPVKTEVSKKQARRMSVVMGVLLPVITVGLLLATPYISSKSFSKSSEELRPQTIELHFNKADLRVESGNHLSVNYQANCFGFPNSKIRPKWNKKTQVFRLQETGWFTEVNVEGIVVLPKEMSVKLYVKDGQLDWLTKDPRHQLIKVK